MKNDENIAKTIEKYLISNKEDMITFLKELVIKESPSESILSQHNILKFIKNEFEKMGYHTDHFFGKETGGYLYARPEERNKNYKLQLLVGHCDTVWPMGTISQMPLTDHEDTLKGPGVYDMKAGITQIVFALRTIRDLSLSFKVTPIVLINSDEEIGSRESTNAIKRLAKVSSRAYVLEPPLGLEGKLKTARKGIGRFTITAKGKAAHAGLDPKQGVNAIVELSHQVQKLYMMNDFDNGITVNIGMIEGGISPNVVAPESKAVIDIRVLNEKDGQYITDKIKALKPKLPGIELIIEGGMGRPPMEKNKRNQILWEKAQTLGKLLQVNLEEATAGGGSDANTTSKYTATLDGLGTPGDGAHATHEYIIKNKIIERTTLLALLLLAEPLNQEL